MFRQVGLLPAETNGAAAAASTGNMIQVNDTDDAEAMSQRRQIQQQNQQHWAEFSKQQIQQAEQRKGDRAARDHCDVDATTAAAVQRPPPTQQQIAEALAPCRPVNNAVSQANRSWIDADDQRAPSISMIRSVQQRQQQQQQQQQQQRQCVDADTEPDHTPQRNTGYSASQLQEALAPCRASAVVAQQRRQQQQQVNVDQMTEEELADLAPPKLPNRSYTQQQYDEAMAPFRGTSRDAGAARNGFDVDEDDDLENDDDDNDDQGFQGGAQH
jgi:hypothetical protein